MRGNGLNRKTKIGAGVIAAVVALCFAADSRAGSLSFNRGALMDIEPNISRLQQEGAITEEERTIFYTLSLGKIFDVEYRPTGHGSRRAHVEEEPLEQEQAIELCDDLLAREELHPDLREWAEAKRLFLVKDTPLYFQKAMEWLDEFPEHPLNLNVRYDIANRFAGSPHCPACYTPVPSHAQDTLEWPPHTLTCAEKLDVLHHIYFGVYADRSLYDEDVLSLAYRYGQALAKLADRLAQAYYNDLEERYPDDEEARRAVAHIGSERKLAVLRLMRAEVEAFLEDPALQEAHQDTLRPEVGADALRMFNSLVNEAERALEQARQIRDNQIKRAAGELRTHQITPEDIDSFPEGALSDFTIEQLMKEDEDERR